MDKTLSDKIAAEAAQKIEHAYCIGEMDERERERKEIAEIIQSALSQSLAARDKEIEELVEKWRGQAHALFTDKADFSDGLSASRDECANDLEALLKGKAI